MLDQIKQNMMVMKAVQLTDEQLLNFRYSLYTQFRRDPESPSQNGPLDMIANKKRKLDEAEVFKDNNQLNTKKFKPNNEASNEDSSDSMPNFAFDCKKLSNIREDANSQ